MSPTANAVIERIDATRQKWWLFTLLSTTVLAVCISFGILLVFMLTDAVVKFSQVTLACMFAAWLTVTVALIGTVVRRIMRNRRSLEATARRIESECPELGSNLINLVQLAEDTHSEGRAFRTAAVNNSVARIGRAPFENAAVNESRWQRFVHEMQTPRDLIESLSFLAVIVALAAMFYWLIPSLSSAATRLLTPWQFVPSVGTVEIVKITPGDVDVLLGGSMEIAAEINNPENAPYKARLFVTQEGEKETQLSMAADGHHRQYTLTLPSVIRPFKYRLEIGDSQSAIYSVGVRHKPTVEQMTVTFHYPSYLDREDETFAQKHGDLEAPQYTVAELHVRPSTPVARGYVQLEGKRCIGRVEQGGKLLVVERMPLLRNATYTVHLFNNAGHTDPAPRINHIHVLPDRPPTVQMLKPPRQSSVAPDAELKVMIRAGDDHGLDRLKLEMKIKQDESETEPSDRESAPVLIHQWTDPDGDTTAVRHYKLKLGEQDIRPGQTVLIRAVARDRRSVSGWGLKLKAQQTAGGWHSIRIVAKDDEAAAALQQLDRLRAAIWKILESQIRARVRAAVILKSNQLSEHLGAVVDVRRRQIAVQKLSVDVVETIGRTDHKERLAIKRALNNLATGDMLRAVQQCDDLAKLSAEAGSMVGRVERSEARLLEKSDNSEKGGPRCARPSLPLNLCTQKLVATQDRIIKVLRKLLNTVRRAQGDALAEMSNRPGGDLPDDVREKLEGLQSKLDEFLEQQKKVIEATENLAKIPVENFTEKEEELLRALAASEDDWSKFLKDFHSDLSKLPEQDFSNPSLLKELVEIQTEIKMAEGALLKKTADIAVPLEQLGYEMAENLKTNLEKWLPDTPDRERWSQEESLSDQDKEAPMAELPGELEDLVGELMEDEDDLFDEMEDVTSSAADSLDAGAGWDALDGPISNMSAKGVTGNRLPNTSEIGGRSGEGRSGKSSGEFVGDEAVGKGGRKTPSRLTPDPYSKGQVKDHSKDPVGGATGGGKESGQGGEGLEGPAPPASGQRHLQRLAGRQAALRNKAEGIDLQFQIMNFHHADLKKMIGLMSQVERDLRSGRYQNALRQRSVIAKGLGNVKQYLEGEFEVRQDATSNLPTDIQKELLGSMRDPSPVGWEELNRQYFERLNAEGNR